MASLMTRLLEKPGVGSRGGRRASRRGGRRTSPPGGLQKQEVGSCLRDGRGTTGSTCQAMVEWLSSRQPLLHVWENVPDIISPKNMENLEWLMAALRKVGYECACSVFKSSSFGHPSARERAYGVCVNIAAMRKQGLNAWVVARQIIVYAQGLASNEILPLRRILLPDTSGWVRGKLRHRIKARKGVE